MLLVVGWDGACWELADRFVAAGAMPTLRRLLDGGRSYEVASTVPPVTFPAWTTFMTGAGPAHHGITDFTVRRPGSYGVSFVNSTHRRLPTIWSSMARAGLAVGVYAMPATYPVEGVCDVEVSGFDTPLGSSQARGFCHPPELGEEIAARYGSLAVEGVAQTRIGPRWHEQALERLLKNVRLRTRIVSDLLRERSFDVFAVHFMESDTVAHHFWQFHDPASPRHREGPADGIEKVYRELDAALAGLIDAAGPGVRVLLVSDHGSGGASDRVVAWNRCLADLGWLAFAPASPSRALAGRLKQAAFSALPQQWQAPLFGALPALASQVESAARLGGIDWSRTRAYSEELPYHPAIWLNLAGRDPQGTIAAGDAEEAADRLCEAVLALRDPTSGEPVVRAVRRRREVCDGPYAHQVPDLVLDLHRPGGYAYGAVSSRGGRERKWLRRLGGKEAVGAKGSSTSGVHRRQGLGLLWGEGIEPCAHRRPCSLADAGVTALALAGLAATPDMEGASVIRPAQPLTAAPGSAPAPVSLSYAPEQERIVAQRLRDLGYLP